MKQNKSFDSKILFVIMGAILALLFSCTNQRPAIQTVTFDANRGTLSGEASVTVFTGFPVSEPKAPTRSGYTFNGWYLKGSSDKYDFSSPVVSDITLVARWTTSSTPPSGTDPGTPGGTTDPSTPGTTDPDTPGTTDPETPSTTITITSGNGLHSPSDTVKLSCSPTSGAVTWVSSDETLATVDSTGLVSVNPRTAATEIQNVTITARVNGAEVGNITIPVGDYSYDESTGTYHIYSELGLNHWADSDNVLTANVTLERDITLTKPADENGSNWTGVGGDSALSSSDGYAATFDGNNKTISGLQMIKLDEFNKVGAYHGFFRVVSEKGIIKNLNLTDVDIYIFNMAIGAIAGCSYGKIENCTVSGNRVRGYTGEVGGIVGIARGGSISGCKNECNVYSYGQQATVGGIVGRAENKCEILNSHNYGVLTLEGDYDVHCGGIVGQLQTYSKVTSCSSSGNIEAKHSDEIKSSSLPNTLSVGGIAGSVSSGSSVTGCSIENIENIEKKITIDASYYSSGLNEEAAVGAIVGKTISNVSTETVVEDNTGTATITKTDLSSSSTSTSV